MAFLQVQEVVRDFWVYDRRKGVLGALANVVKPKRSTVRALAGISFSVDEGELVGLAGPNGAGKSPALRLLAGSFLHSPDIVYLDEPTIGLDVVAKERIRRFLRDVNRELGVTIILTTHDLSDVEQVCRRLLMMDQGKIIWDGGIDEIKARFGGKCTLTLDFEFEPEGFEAPPGTTVAKEEGPKKWVEFDRKQTSVMNIIQELVGRYRIRDLSLRETSIEEIVRNIYQQTELVQPQSGSASAERRD